MTKLGLGLAAIHRLAVMALIQQVGCALMGDQFLPILETRTGVYSNVTVTLKTAGGIHIRHDRGIGNVELSELDDEAKAALGYPVDRKENGGGGEGVGALPAGWADLLRRVRDASGGEAESPIKIPFEVNPVLIGGIFLVGLLFHLFFSYCSRLICLKAGSDPGVLIWLPILQIFPLFRAAGMSSWWFLGLLVPVLNLVVQILWCFKIVNARGKPVIWAILLILPLVNLAAFLYLAFSSDETSQNSLKFPAFSPRTA